MDSPGPSNPREKKDLNEVKERIFIKRGQNRLEAIEKKLKDEYNQKFEEYKKEKISEAMAQLKKEYDEKLDEARKKIWCKKCLAPADLLCCFGTVYCSEECQKLDWPEHEKICQRADE